MINLGKYSILGINVNAVDYDFAVSTITEAARNKKPFSVSALAVHGVMTGFLDSTHARRLNGLDMVVPDGQPVRWALAGIYKKRLPDRVYGPNLTLKVAESLTKAGLSIYLYGSKKETLEKFARNLRRLYPGFKIAGMEESKFRRLNPQERLELVERIRAS
ncbi:MAG: WecB/TagA/CpsF family glycosyltransferase, partial [Cyanobacteria bacterium J06629_2]